MASQFRGPDWKESTVHTFSSPPDVTEALEGADEAVERAREQLYEDIGYTENEEWKYPKEVCLCMCVCVGVCVCVCVHVHACVCTCMYIHYMCGRLTVSV